MLTEPIAGHAGVSYIQTSGAYFESHYTGEAEKLLRQTFKLAQDVRPTILCIDEIDSLASQRIKPHDATGYEKSLNALTNQFLTLLSQENLGVVVFGTTNHRDGLDPAAFRQGRFNKIIELPLPSLEARIDLLKIALNNKPVEASFDYRDFAETIDDCSGADIFGIVNSAAEEALLNQSQCITTNHLIKAHFEAKFGVSGEVDPLSLEEKAVIALHEAGHAIVAQALNHSITQITIVPTTLYRGYTLQKAPKDIYLESYQSALNIICIKLAGRAAEIIYDKIGLGAEDDLHGARRIAKKIAHDNGLGSSLSGFNAQADVEEILQSQLKRAIRIIQENQLEHQRVVKALAEHGTLDASAFLRACRGEEAKPEPKRIQNSLWKNSPPRKKPVDSTIALPPSRFKKMS